MTRNIAVDGCGLRLYANVTAPDDAIADQLAGNELGGVDGDGEAESLCRQDGRRINANDLAGGIDQRSARISRIQCGVSLDYVVNQAAGLRAQGASQRADHA